MTDDENEYAEWVYRCHRPVPKKQREEWIKFYASWFRSDEGSSATEYLLEHGSLKGWKFGVQKR
jgi:hypothetical protein